MRKTSKTTATATATAAPLQRLTLLLPLPLLLVLLFAATTTVRAAPEEDRILEIPGWGPPPTPQYSGYLDASDSEGCGGGTVDDDDDDDDDYNGPVCKIHYWLAMADVDDDVDDDDAKPTVLWLNGGPGSSSLLGFVQEVGPLLLNATGGLMENPWAWTKAGANLVAIEAPVGVGFSYCSRQLRDDGKGGPCVNTDTRTAQASRAALVDFFSRKFPELRDNGGGFYVAGESYAGVYIPTLSKELLTHPDAKEHVPLKGILVGDPCTDNDAQRDSMDPLWYSRKYGLVDDEIFDVLRSDRCSGYLSRALLRTMRRSSSSSSAADDDDDDTGGSDVTGTHSSKSHRSVGKKWSARVAASNLNHELTKIEDLDRRRLRAEELYRERVLGIATEEEEEEQQQPSPRRSGDDVDDDDEDESDHRLRAVAASRTKTKTISSDGGGGEGEDEDDDPACRLAYRKFLVSSSDALSQGWHDMFIDDYSLFAPITTKEDEQMTEYFNRADVRAALHVEETPDDPWPSPRAGFSYRSEYNACNWDENIRFPNTTMVDVYRDVLPELDRVWIYNGDTDPCVSYEGTREAVKRILSNELDGGSYRPWFYRQEAATLKTLAEKSVLFGPDLVAQTLERAQFAGEVTSYEGGLSFVTFHGSGHMVPQFRPQSSLHFLKRFLHAPIGGDDGDEGAELTPLLPTNATLRELDDEAFERAMDEWTEAARAAADDV